MSSPQNADGRPSLAWNLGWSLLVSLTVLSAGLGAILYLSASHLLTRDFDQSLISQARALASMVEDQGAGKLAFEPAEGFVPEFGPGGKSIFFQIWRSDGSVLEKSPALGHASLPVFGGPLARPLIQAIPLPTGRPGRAVGILFVPAQADQEGNRQQPSPGPMTTLVLARDSGTLDTALARVGIVTLLAVILLPVGAAALVFGVLRRGLTPVRRLAAAVDRIGPTTLSVRVGDTKTPRELYSMESGINRLLERLETAFERERSFAADVSHELKTPLSEAMSSLSVALQWPEDRALTAESLNESLGALRRMQHILNAMIDLRLNSAPEQNLPTEPLDLSCLIDQTISELQPTMARRSLTLSWFPGTPGAYIVQATPILSAVVVRNMISNAVQHAPEGSAIQITLTESPLGGRALAVTNSAPDLNPSDIPALFQPFWRKDPARTANSTHSGLGLTIAAAYARLGHMDLDASLQPDGTLCLICRWPPPPDSPDL